MNNSSDKKQIQVALYTRVSTEDQAREGYSLDIQRDSLIEFSKKQDWQIHFLDDKNKIYEDDGYSGYSLDRPALNQLLEDARARKFDLVLVYKLDRFSRRLKDLLNLLDELENLDIEFKSATEPYDTTSSSGKLMLQQLGSFAEFERNRIIERVFPGMVRGVQEGHWQGARYAPYGYHYDKTTKRLEIVEEEAKLVKEIFEKYLSGLSTQKIGGELYKREIKTRSGGLFNSSLVRKMLRNKIYIGKLVWNAHHYDRKQKTLHGYRYVKNDPSKIIEATGNHWAIVSEEIFYQVQALLDQNRKGRFVRRRVRDYPLSGVITCAKCGNRYNGISNVKNHRTGEKRPYYRCSGRALYNIKCHNGDVRSEILESQVFEVLDVLFSAKEVTTERLRNLVADQYRNRATGEATYELEAMRKDLQAYLQKQSDLTDVYLEGTINRGIFKQKMQKLRNEEGELRIKVERMELRLVEKEKSKEYVKKAQEIVKSTQSVKENLHPASRKEFLMLIFKRLPVENRSIEKFELYEPFRSMYQNALANRRANEKTGRKEETWNRKSKKHGHLLIKNQSCLLRPSDVR